MTLEVGVDEQAPLYFVCYSRSQRDLVEKIDAKLAARRRRGELEVWRDKQNLEPGEEYTPEIIGALQRAAGAVVVISDTWYASDYIHAYEWPKILARKNEDARFRLFLLAFNSLDDDDPLRARNFVNDLTDELLLECSDAVRDSVLTRLSNLVGEHARSFVPDHPEPPTAVPAAADRPEPTQTLPDAGPGGAAEPALNGVPALPEHFVEPEELGQRGPQRPGAREVAIADARDLRDAGRHGDARVDEARDRAHLLATLEPHGSDLDDARARAHPRRLEVDDRPDGARQRRARRGRQADEADAAVVVADKARVVSHHLLQHAPGELARDARKSQEGARRPFRRERLATLLDQGCQAVGCSQLELERRDAGPAGRWRPACHANTCSHVCRTPPPAVA